MLSPLILAFFAASSQLPEDPGSYQITVRDVQHYDNYYSRGNVSARVYYPSSGGPYPLVAFMHGWWSSASDYDLICEQIRKEYQQDDYLHDLLCKCKSLMQRSNESIRDYEMRRQQQRTVT